MPTLAIGYAVCDSMNEQWRAVSSYFDIKASRNLSAGRPSAIRKEVKRVAHETGDVTTGRPSTAREDVDPIRMGYQLVP